MPALTAPESYPNWLETIRWHVFPGYWIYFDPNGPGAKCPTEPEVPEPVEPPQLEDDATAAPPARSTRSANPPATIGSQDFMPASQRVQQFNFELYCKRMTVFSCLWSEYERYIEETKVRALVSESVPSHIMSRIYHQGVQHPRDVLIRLKEMMDPNPTQN